MLKLLYCLMLLSGILTAKNDINRYDYSLKGGLK